ncbi:hypothetical protein DICVIV_03501 [Dictyocaulus viviparus]|uniref:Uncharacterized protein n=1 Tax=Dictyocaulus viviparus TaxID=29172 RepID=A0A0D8Y0C5_DICVI|nr:hypothetical protein DICVIV_03501 [Dictyocaulus viviparus]
MFMAHRVVLAEESARVRGRVTCALHSEPDHFVSINAGYRICTEKIEKLASKLRLYQEEMREELEARERLLIEQTASYHSAKDRMFFCDYYFSLYQLCQQIQDTVLSTRDRLSSELDQSHKMAEETCRQQIRQISSIMAPIRLCLMSTQILCSSASPVDVLQLSGELNKRVQSLVTRSFDKLPPIRVVDSIEARTEIAKSLEPFLGTFDIILIVSLRLAAVREGSFEGSGSVKSYKIRSGQHSMPTMLTKFQTMIDLSGAFGSIFTRVEDYNEYFTFSCAGVETRLGLHSAILNDLQSELQQMWQEQLDRVRRQQIIYREKVEECLTMRETARLVLTAAKQLGSYAACIESMSALIDPKRCHPPDPAPMESICMQISGIEPNSETRIQAIEKEEQNRRAVQEAKKKEELAERGTPVKSLKHGKARRKDTQRLLVNTNRERSPGGTDSTLINPCLTKKMWREVLRGLRLKFSRRYPTLREEALFDIELETPLRQEDFELIGDEQFENADLSIQGEERCSSSLSLTISSNSMVTPFIDQQLERIPLASRVTADVGMSHQSMLQSLHDVFASQKSGSTTSVCEEPNVLASVVKALTQKTSTQSSAHREIEQHLCNDRIDTSKTFKKERRRRKKRSSDTVCSQADCLVDDDGNSVEIASVPVVPYIPRAIFSDFEIPTKQLGSFEAKEKMLRSLKEKIGRSQNIS